MHLDRYVVVQNLTDALTDGHHFTQAGFKALLESWAGEVGAVVHVYEGGHSYQVEFTTYDGRTVAAAKVSAEQIRPLGSKEIHHARAFEPAVR